MLVHPESTESVKSINLKVLISVIFETLDLKGSLLLIKESRL